MLTKSFILVKYKAIIMSSEKISEEIVTVKNVPKHLKRQLQNVSNWTGDSMSALMRPKIREVIDSFPEHYREEYTED